MESRRPSHTASSSDEGGRLWSTGFWRQLYAAVATNMSSAALGTVLCWTATALPDLRHTPKFSFSESQENWIGPFASLGAIAACPIAGILIEKLGRRRSLLALNLPFVLGFLLIGFAQNVEMIYLGRFITGFCAGAFSIAAPVFVTEFSSPGIRGALTSVFDMMTTVGILYIFLVGTYASWEVQAFACAAVAMVCHALLLPVPESPRYLVEMGRDAEAKEALAWFRGEATSGSGMMTSQRIDVEFADLQKSMEESRSKSFTFSNIFSASVLKPTAIGLALMIFQQLTGIDAICFYIVDIFASTGTPINENLSTNIIGVVQMSATVVCALVIDRYGRRILLLLSEAFMVLALGGLGLFFYLRGQEAGPVGANLAWLPLASLLVYVIAFSVGFGPIPWLILPEIAPTHAKGAVSGLVTISRWSLGFVVTLVFKDVMTTLGDAGGYWLLGGFCAIGAIFVYFFVPETKGKTLDEIQLYFNPPAGIGSIETTAKRGRCDFV